MITKYYLSSITVIIACVFVEAAAFTIANNTPYSLTVDLFDSVSEPLEPIFLQPHQKNDFDFNNTIFKKATVTISHHDRIITSFDFWLTTSHAGPIQQEALYFFVDQPINDASLLDQGSVIAYLQYDTKNKAISYTLQGTYIKKEGKSDPFQLSRK
jgi:hypothetical protein